MLRTADLHPCYIKAVTFKRLILTCCYLLSFTCRAEVTVFPDVTLQGLVDFRLQSLSAPPGELEYSLGKFRSGGDFERIGINEAALTLHSRLSWDWSGSVTVKYANRQSNPVDLTEAFLSYRPVSTSAWRFGARLGMFFPPISLENTGTAWSSPYTLSSSVINAWVGAELKAFGAEAQLSYFSTQGDRWKLFAAGFANNDTAGALLAWRGWSIHDYEATLQDKLRLPNAIGVQTQFPQQATFSQPFVEVDGRPGYYAGLSVERPNRYSFRAQYYDNRGKPSALVNGQYAWHTDFWSLGLKTELPWDLTLISQGISGRTQMGDESNGQFAVDVRFWAASVLLSKTFDQHRLSARYEQFGTRESDFLPQDRNNENGYALTANYNFTWAQRHQINFEFSYISSNRAGRFSLGQNPTQEETLWQIAYRLFF